MYYTVHHINLIFKNGIVVSIRNEVARLWHLAGKSIKTMKSALNMNKLKLKYKYSHNLAIHARS